MSSIYRKLRTIKSLFLPTNNMGRFNYGKSVFYTWNLTGLCEDDAVNICLKWKECMEADPDIVYAIHQLERGNEGRNLHVQGYLHFAQKWHFKSTVEYFKK